MHLSRQLAVVALLLFCASAAQAQKAAREPKTHKILPDEKAQEVVLRILNDTLRPGDTIEFAEGTFHFTQELTIRTNKVTIRGQGVDKTILSFKKQNQGKQGILVNRDDFTIEGLTIEDTKGDGVKVEGGKNVAFRRVRARWNGTPKASNGAYGLYPVQCKGVLLEDCEAYGASDAGIYVGQSETIIVRRCKAERNVVGIEVENSSDADIYDNVTTNNSCGLLICLLPDLPVKKSERVRAFKNEVTGNNHPNFATEGTLVASVNPGTGLMVLAADQVQVFNNKFKGNDTFNLAVVSYLITGREYKDKEFDPISEGVSIHDNTFADGGTKPKGERGALFAALLDTPIPDIVWDGVVNPARQKDGKGSPGDRIVFRNNGAAKFANLNWGLLGKQLADAKDKKAMQEKILAHRDKVDRDVTAYAGTLEPLPEVKLPGGK